MKTPAQVISDAIAALAPLGVAHSIVEGDILNVIADAMVAMQAGGGLKLPSQGATPIADSVTGTSWQALDLFSSGGGSGLPAGGGRGLTPNTTASTLTVESGGDGWYLALYHVHLDSSEALEVAIERDRSAAKTRLIESRYPNVSGAFAINLQNGDYVRLVGRTGTGLTANLSYWSAQLFLLRVLPT